MSGAAYQRCEVCDGKALYDGDCRVDDYFDNGGKAAFLCQTCAPIHDLVALNLGEADIARKRGGVDRLIALAMELVAWGDSDGDPRPLDDLITRARAALGSGGTEGG